MPNMPNRPNMPNMPNMHIMPNMHPYRIYLKNVR